MTKDEEARARATAILAKLNPKPVPTPALKPAPVDPPMSATEARAIIVAETKDLPPIVDAAPAPIPATPVAPPAPPPTRWQRAAVWFNTPLLKPK